MNAWAFRLYFYAEFIAVPYHFRFIQRNLIPVRRDYPIAFAAYRFHRMEHFYIFTFHLRHITQHIQQLIFACNALSHQITQHFVIVGIIHIQLNGHAAGCHIHSVHFAFPYVLAFQPDAVACNILHAA